MKNLLIGILAVVCILLAVYGFVQRSEAQTSRLMVEENAAIVVALEKHALEQKMVADASRAEAERQRLMAEEALAKCAKKK